MVDKFIQGAIKKPGALRKELKVPEGKKIPAAMINKKISMLQEEAKGGKKLSAARRLLLRRLILARTLRKFK